jgi:putative FmdB family regulatory protein
MPIYEYECDNCHEVFEINQKATDPAPAECPACGKGPLEKIISRTTFQLKGGGWYATDYKGNGGAPPKPGAWADNDKPAGKSYLEQSASERKSTIKDITNSVANKI